MTDASAPLRELRQEIGAHLDDLAAFWSSRAPDRRDGGFFTCFDADGDRTPGETEKHLVSQSRLVWTFASLAAHYQDERYMDLARGGYADLRRCFLDAEHGGWYWRATRGGQVLDAAKLVYGQSFALYALATLARVGGDDAALEDAVSTFDVLQVRAVDALHGGYFENFERDWTPCTGRYAAGDRKSLDIHLHLLESFTELARATRSATHLRRLGEVRELVLTRMLDENGAGGNQYDSAWLPIDPIVIDRTWLADRLPDVERGPFPVMLTSYGHNLELAWLLGRADDVLGSHHDEDAPLVRRIAGHALAHGYDAEHGGVYREGPPDGDATDRDKEFWQNAEALVGFLHADEVCRDSAYLDAFAGTWRFVRRFLISPQGEWRTRVSRTGEPVDPALGNYWTGGYHTVRAALECVRRLDALTAPTG